MINIEYSDSMPIDGVSDPVIEQTPTIFDAIDEFRRNHPYVATVAESSIVWGARQIIIQGVRSSSDVELGHGWKDTKAGQIFNKTAVATVCAIALAPLAEEYMFRKKPSDYLAAKGRNGLEPKIGILMAGLFALGHAGPRALPIPQFVGGLNYWRLARARGYRHAALGHATHNVLSIITQPQSV